MHEMEENKNRHKIPISNCRLTEAGQDSHMAAAWVSNMEDMDLTKTRKQL